MRANEICTRIEMRSDGSNMMMMVMMMPKVWERRRYSQWFNIYCLGSPFFFSSSPNIIIVSIVSYRMRHTIYMCVCVSLYPLKLKSWLYIFLQHTINAKAHARKFCKYGINLFINSVFVVAVNAPNAVFAV